MILLHAVHDNSAFLINEKYIMEVARTVYDLTQDEKKFDGSG